jgi:alpha-ketoglutarate-dependent taurine dioxygenase
MHMISISRNVEFRDKEALLSYAKRMGSLLEWDFGSVMEMRVHEEPKNYLFTHGSVPFHWDGAFHKEPHYLLFYCIEAPLPECGGETIFSNTTLVWEDATEQEKAEWRNIKITYKTEKLAHYGGKITVPLVQEHPFSKETIIRFAEPVGEDNLNPVSISIDGYSLDETNRFIKKMADKFYDAKYCYTHTWDKNDLLIVDNFTFIHGRKAFTNFSPRHLRRIQIL